MVRGAMSIVDQWSGQRARLSGAGAGVAARPMPPSAITEIVDLLAVPHAAWDDLAARSVEPNAFYLRPWAQAVSRHAEGKTGARVLLAWDGPARTRLIGLLPVVSAWRAYKIPIPVFVAWQGYSPLTTPLLDRDKPEAAAHALIVAAAKAGAMALSLPAIADDGAAATALRAALATSRPVIFERHDRARLDATLDGDAALETLGSKKLKELRRQRNRLADTGEVAFKVAAPGAESDAALAAFLSLEAAGWKGERGTALACKPGDRAFMTEALPRMVATGEAQLATLSSGDTITAAGVVLRHGRRAYFFKIAYDEAMAKCSPGVQLTLDITRALCADAGIDDVDSTAISGHPMIDHIWRARLAVADMLVPVAADGATMALFAAMFRARRVLRATAKSIVHKIKASRGQKP